MSKILSEDAYKIIFSNKGMFPYFQGNVFFFLLNKENYHTPETILLLKCL